MSSSLNPRYYRTAKVEEIEKKTERPMEYFTREKQRPNSTNMRKPPASEPRKLESKLSEDINESAENFIKKFKQQLLLQRLESIENYEQMLKRGT
ncbi:pathogen-associated molecular patterns-induced protein A70 [Solanum dulcamara]|uniref:pathogen-associated molecular patterns-induced protein A70 n=1 Tax=Solanum dulcamara TaxID=45834 RepID=UPI002486503D|nr:pathogen-associated molecular patterns-induced protein A70 [Solanum dulcamara]